MTPPAGPGLGSRLAEELSRARARGARVYAEISGYGATCDAHHRVRLDETGEESARAMTLALGEAGLDPAAIDYVAYHGTSTGLNDKVETRAMRRAFGGAAIFPTPYFAMRSVVFWTWSRVMS